MRRIKNKVAYFYLIITISFIRILSELAGLFSFLLPQKANKKDLILFPYTQNGSDGYSRRFGLYVKLLQNDKLDFYIAGVFSDEYIVEMLSKNDISRYKLYRQIAWKRYFQVLNARNFKRVFIHRNLFPYFPDLKTPFFEKLIRKLNHNIIVDFWDSVWIHNNTLVENTVRYATKLSVVNNFIRNHFNHLDIPISIFPIGVETEKYEVKSNYFIDRKVKFFYTGSPSNVRNFLNYMYDVFVQLSKEIEFKLIIVSREHQEYDGIEIDTYDFNIKTYYKLLKEADIGLYAIEDDDISNGKMAAKVLDYMSTGLPCIASPYGLTPYAINEENILFSKTLDDWKKNLLKIVNSQSYREYLGTNARNTILKEHSLEKSYMYFKDIIHL